MNNVSFLNKEINPSETGPNVEQIWGGHLPFMASSLILPHGKSLAMVTAGPGVWRL